MRGNSSDTLTCTTFACFSHYYESTLARNEKDLYRLTNGPFEARGEDRLA